MKRILFSLFILILSTVAFAHDFKVDGIFYDITSYGKKTVAVTYQGDSYDSYTNEYTDNIVIPDFVTYDNTTYSVTSIIKYAFYKCSVTSVTIPETVTDIGNCAFMRCSYLTSIVVPCGVMSIGQSAFNYCISLTSINIPNSVTSIGGSAFANCTNLTSVTIPNSVTSIGGSTFYNCSKLTSIIIPNSITSSIGQNTFWGCRNLASVTIGNRVTSIGACAFYDCCNLTSITIPNSVTSIGYNAFYNCSALTSISIGNGVTNIGSDAFYNCNKLKRINVLADNPPIVVENSFSNYNMELYVFEPYINTYKALTPWSNFTSINPLENVAVFKIAVTNGGRILYNKTELSNEIHNIYLLKNEQIEINIIPDNGYEIEYVTLDGYDITSQISGNKLFLEISADSELNVVFKLIDSSINIIIGSTGNTTFCSKYNLDFSNVEGIKVYTATAYNSIKDEITLVKVRTSKTAMGLYASGNPGIYQIPIIDESRDNSLNMFVGVNEETTISTTDGSYTNYIYTKPSGKEAGFYKVTSDRTIPAGKAYLQIPTAWLNEETTSEAKAVKLVFDDGESTGIDEVNRVESKEDVIYDLQGRRVLNPSKGIYIINGRKVVR